MKTPEAGQVVRLRNSAGKITESTVVAVGEPKSSMLTFQNHKGTFPLSIKAFQLAVRQYGVKE